MKKILLSLLCTISVPLLAAPNKSIVCHDTEFGDGHLKLIIADTKSFFAPREQKPMVKGDFWIKGEKFVGILEQSTFMADWSADSGWYRSTPSPLDFSLCNWKKCPVRKVKLMIHTKDQLKAEGNIKFLVQTTENDRSRYDRKLNCEIK